MAVGDELIELPLPFAIAPQIGIALIVAAEVDVGARSQRRIERSDLHDAGRKRIGNRRGLRPDAADVVHQEAVVANGSAGVQHGVEDVAVFDPERRVRGGVVARPGQQVRGTARQARRGVAVIRGARHAGRGVALRDRREVDRHVAIGAFGLVRQAAVDGRVVDLLREGFGVRHAPLHRPRPAVHAAVARVHEVVERDELRGEVVIVRREQPAELRQRRIAVRPVREVAKHLIEGPVLLDDVDHVLDALAQEPHHLRVFAVGLGRIGIVLRDHLRQFLEMIP